jgi:hypothetical protein
VGVRYLSNLLSKLAQALNLRRIEMGLAFPVQLDMALVERCLPPSTEDSTLGSMYM